jgi:lipopolysaccharide export system protein LptA
MKPVLPSITRRIPLRRVAYTGLMLAVFGLITHHSPTATAQAPGQALTLRSDIQEANSITGVITARGNVQIDYPARQIQATSAEARYFSREQRIVLTGDVYVLQEGNSLRGEVVTYLIEQGRFVAQPRDGQQVQSIYIVPDENPSSLGSGTSAPVESDFDPKTEIREPVNQ